jgi:hypothetical protein
MKTLILTEDDFYQSSTGRTLRGGTRQLFNADLAVVIKCDGEIEVLKDRFSLSKEEIRIIVEFDERILLML